MLQNEGVVRELSESSLSNLDLPVSDVSSEQCCERQMNEIWSAFTVCCGVPGPLAWLQPQVSHNLSVSKKGKMFMYIFPPNITVVCCKVYLLDVVLHKFAMHLNIPPLNFTTILRSSDLEEVGLALCLI